MKKNKSHLSFIYMVLILGAILTIAPYVWMALTSLKAPAEVFGGNLIPLNPTLENYVKLFKLSPFPLYFWNSLVVAFFVVILNVFFDSLAGFAFAKYKFPGKERLFWVVLLTLMVPPQITLIPSYMILARFNLTNTLTGVIIGGIVSAFGIFLMRQYISTIPDELIEASRIDGCSDFQIFRKIILPISRPALGALSIFHFVAAWNSYLWPLIVLQKQEKFTLPVGLAQIQGIYGTPVWAVQMAGAFIATLPIVIFFFIMQKSFISGITLGSVKE